MRKILFVLFSILFVFALVPSYVIANEFNIPIYWVLKTNGERIDFNNNGLVDYCDNSTQLQGYTASYFINKDTQLYNSIHSLNNYSLPEIVSSIGNWSADKANYYTKSEEDSTHSSIRDSISSI